MTALDKTQRILRVDHLGKSYKLYDSPSDRLKEILGRRDRHRVHWALRDVSFELNRGECLGVVGDNGAGKSTLLKLITQTLRPTTGSLQREGRVTAILELGAGFHPAFTGRENLYFSGAIIGIPKPEMQRLEASIIEFSELEAAIDRPVKTYSSGMVVRLAFALVTAVIPDILIIDEALAVGDQHFQKKCAKRIQEFRQRGCAILFCSHSMYHVRKLCDQAIWLHEGGVRAIGEVEPVIADYEQYVRGLDSEPEQPPAPDAVVLHPPPVAAGAHKVRAELISVEIGELDHSQPPQLLGSDLLVTVTALARQEEPPSIAVMLERADGVGITAVGSHHDRVWPRRLDNDRWQTCLRFPDLPLYSGEYRVSAYLFDHEGVLVLDEWLQHAAFRVVYPTLEVGLVRLPHEWL